jgi:hypothetical protein
VGPERQRPLSFRLMSCDPGHTSQSQVRNTKAMGQSSCSVALLVKKFPAFYETKRFITLHHRSPTSARLIQSTHPRPHLPEINFSIIVHLRPDLPTCIFPLGIPTNILYAFLISHACYKPRLTYPSRPDHPCNIWYRIQITELLITRFSPASCHFTLLWSKYSQQHPVLKHPHTVFLPYCERPSFTPIQNSKYIYSIVFPNLCVSR